MIKNKKNKTRKTIRMKTKSNKHRFSLFLLFTVAAFGGITGCKVPETKSVFESRIEKTKTNSESINDEWPTPLKIEGEAYKWYDKLASAKRPPLTYGKAAKSSSK